MTEEDIARAEWVLAAARGRSTRWFVCPVENKELGMGPGEYHQALRKSGIGLVHATWSDANEAVKRLSEVGGVLTAVVVSEKFSVVAEFDNGEKV